MKSCMYDQFLYIKECVTLVKLCCFSCFFACTVLQWSQSVLLFQTPYVNLLQEKHLITPEGVETAKPVIPNDNRNINCSPE